ncbi:MAG: hypothetical protein HY074_12475 [Deltaproteobacteria bacterium]|nr:hypothetical protein [Deltaproteobacteria bacterium]
MLFNSFNFLLIFLPIVLVVGLWLKGQRLLGWITGTSFVFYAFAGHVWFLVPMLFTTVLDFFVAQRMQAARGRSRRHWLYLSLAGNLGLLMYFKYSRLFWPSVNVILPAGISFYTFQTLSYIIDVYRSECEAERGFLRFAGFVSFFPHLVAGPLTRHNQLIPALAGI